MKRGSARHALSSRRRAAAADDLDCESPCLPSLSLHETKNPQTYVIVQEPDPVDGAVRVSPLRRIPVDGLVDERAPDAAESIRGARQSFESGASTGDFGEEPVFFGW